MDKFTLEKIDLLHPKLREEAHDIYDEICKRLTGNATVRFLYTLRTFAEQAEIYAQGRTKPGKIVTKANAGLSLHNYGLAIDICLLVDKDGNGTFETAVWDVDKDFDKDKKADWLECVQVFKEFGWTWGGDWLHFRDMPHFQKTFGYSVRDLLKLYNAGKVDKNNYVLI